MCSGSNVGFTVRGFRVQLGRLGAPLDCGMSINTSMCLTLRACTSIQLGGSQNPWISAPAGDCMYDAIQLLRAKLHSASLHLTSVGESPGAKCADSHVAANKMQETQPSTT